MDFQSISYTDFRFSVKNSTWYYEISYGVHVAV